MVAGAGMTFAVRTMLGVAQPAWEHLGYVGQLTSSSIGAPLPVTASAGDLLVVVRGLGSGTSLGDKTDNIGSSARIVYKVCSGGETQYYSSGGSLVTSLMMFRPGGVAAKKYGLSQTIPSTTTISTAPVGPGLYICALSEDSNGYVTSAPAPSGVIGSGYSYSGLGAAWVGYKLLDSGEVVGSAEVASTSPYAVTRAFGIFDFA